MKRYLAVDFGLKRVGLAVNHEWLAEPLKVVDYTGAIEAIQTIVKDAYIEEILVGVADGPIADRAREFAQLLREKTGLPVQTVDETLSTKESDAKVLMSGMSMSDRRKPRDHYAAATFLQDYLDTAKS